jgi:hypothetical protein
MRINGLLPVILVFVMLLAVYFGYSQSHVSITPESFMPNIPLDGGIFLLVSVALIYGGKVLYKEG